MPAKDEILDVVTDTRMIVAPVGYRDTIANYGDVGVSQVYFSIDKNIHGIDLTQEKTEISINIQRNDFTVSNTIAKENKVLFSQNSSKVLLIWDVPPELTNGIDNENNPIYGKFTISITLTNADKTKKWSSSPYENLTIGESILSNGTNPGGIRNDFET